MTKYIKIDLTDDQREALEPLFECSREQNAAGKYGSIVAQVYPDAMVVSALSPEKAKTIRDALLIARGLDPNDVPIGGSKTSEEHMEYIQKHSL